LKQEIQPAMRIFCLGDCVLFRLRTDSDEEGNAFLRTNLGRAAVKRQEIIDFTEKEKPQLDRAWHDLPMLKKKAGCWEIKLPLIEVGCFEAKCWFLRGKDKKQLWTEGQNFYLKIEPSRNLCANTIYTAFTRQFGRNICAWHDSGKEKDARKLLDKMSYNVIPPSGTFRDLISKLDFIINNLHSRIIQLLPVHPAPTIYGRMGTYGSPFASLDYFAIDPALAEFDKSSTPLDQFLELVDAVHYRNARIFLDIPVNHTGWASRLHGEHPEWFVRNPDGSFQSPGAWGTVWADLCKLDYKLEEVHTLMAKVFLYWCRHGVDGFRCDAGYMLPVEAWRYIVAKVRSEYPDTVFLLEGLGGPKESQESLLTEAGLDWAYSELFQNYSREDIQNYYPYASEMTRIHGCFVAYAETHDNNRLAAKSIRYAQMRTAMTALFSHNGAFGITNGVEWFATEKIDVHEASPLNWGSSKNQAKEIRRLQVLLETHSAFFAGSETEIIGTDHTETLAMRRIASDLKSELLVLVNLDIEDNQQVKWPAMEFDIDGSAYDLLSGKRFEISKQDHLLALKLEKGQVICLTRNKEDIDRLENALRFRQIEPPALTKQRQRAELLKVYSHYHSYNDISQLDINSLLDTFVSFPEELCAQFAGKEMPDITVWHAECDHRREVMIPKDDLILIKCAYPFRAEIKKIDETEAVAESMALNDGTHFAIVKSLKNNTSHVVKREIQLRIFEKNTVRKETGVLKLLPNPGRINLRNSFDQKQVQSRNISALLSNDLGGMSQIRGAWGTVQSKYDALLAANFNRQYPVDRQVMFSRCRAWLVHSDYSRELNISCLESFKSGNGNCVKWIFKVPAGQGKSVPLHITLMMPEHGNAVALNIKRPASSSISCLRNDIPVKLIIRPDLEDRINHQTTRAMDGPENQFRKAVAVYDSGFEFKPAKERCFKLESNYGTFIPETEWSYMVDLPLERERGLESSTDMFSPGYFQMDIKSEDEATLFACADNAENIKGLHYDNFDWSSCFLNGFTNREEVFKRSIRHFVVRRDQYHSVIAGYPWFLDWGRDTLICLRGMIASGMLEEAKNIILQFASFEKDGTLPNMIRGKDDSNRDTSDAPLWLFVAVRDYCKETGNDSIMQEDCNGRSVLQVLNSIIKNYYHGTPNGIGLDRESGLIFSPAHFTWMDTNYPACTPREGYPVEIQALWISALELAGKYDEVFLKLRGKAIKSLARLYWLPDKNYFSDCLHASKGQTAALAAADDACRPNQLLAITLNCIRGDFMPKNILRACEKLLVPGAIRSLADCPVNFELPVKDNGKLLNDPKNPFWPYYNGNEDTRRKPAYHNGTAWTWVFPSFCEALQITGGKDSTKRSKGLLMSLAKLMESGIVGQVPEILDGAAPHEERGCGSQAWGMTELYRVYKILENQ
jgi:predicted glycogen debranching enzyme